MIFLSLQPTVPRIDVTTMGVLPGMAAAKAGTVDAFGADKSAACTDQLSCLTAADVYRYMAQKHHATIMGVLLAMAAAKAGTIDPIVSKMLCTHAASSLSCYWC